GLRFEDEFVRHKILDLLGDLWSLQAPLKARITAWKASHALHVRLAKALFEEHRGERA
ncbi:MAG TPA: UDP-3-O-acyl-N-acetylglucosamine deacetylase, partial [Deltaproteobacteria bacterium]|nr:UDP-3-O-acyl-N-acetylglucosamine deacetylase [Deltaproteobacteria bacterium]